MLIEGQTKNISAVSLVDGANYPLTLGQSGDLLVSELHGKFYTQTKRGNLWHATLQTAAAIPVTSTTAPTFFFWNPAGNIRNAVLVRLRLGWAATTEAPGNVQLAVLTGLGTDIATGSAITAFTAVTSVYNGLLGSGNSTGLKVGSAATITAATKFIELGLSHLTTTGTATFGTFQSEVNFDGELIVPPGTAVFPVASTATASTYNHGLVWYDAPL